jgi:hypothetical protein
VKRIGRALLRFGKRAAIGVALAALVVNVMVILDRVLVPERPAR